MPTTDEDEDKEEVLIGRWPVRWLDIRDNRLAGPMLEEGLRGIMPADMDTSR